ncbi:hypothetical protein VBL11_06610 [Enterobacter cloacae]|uniref:hypothetical protein n=1 Tax=Enterobacter cloacae TaxID=550 RepID=UPI002B1DDCB5|nr:hypothetical protein [Enterobacter cloacae]MEA3722055.1 hypothetical protein [Enterobacter cloacae]MEA3727902.1 hypothetical protein [Enterobacter cloacae]MEA3736334.1 hypothetical protein [Enterobacter cloacae]MEA3750404.1 hypothetical protein [Enterobacter cloacae]MEA3764397.1 hypothetical protein [Enterobacter cloacae]
MSTITKEWLQQTIAEYEANRDELPFGLDTNSAIELQAFKLALASLEAEPAGVVRHIELRGPEHPAGIHVSLYSRLDDGIELYTAPPAQVVPDMAAFGEMPFLGTQEKAFVSGWNACRAAMLLDSEPDFREISNSSTNNFRENAETSTKCWCHTCRPVKISDMRFVVCPDCGNKRCPHANDHRNACTGSNEPGQEGSAYPAAPQQEVTQALAKGMERYGDAMQELAQREVKP